MSARPNPLERPSDEELDLLISRSLDGDLTPEEEQELARLVSADPQVRDRRERMAALVGELGRVPSPVPPFALATRVTSRVLEKAGGVGLPSGLVGRAPKMGMIFATLGILGLVAIYRLLTGGSVLGPVPASQVASREAARAAPADSSREPVQVFFEQSGAKKSASASPSEAPATGTASRPDPVLVAEARQAAPAPEAATRARAGNETAAKEKAEGAASAAKANEADAADAADAFAPEPLSKTDTLASRDDAAKDEREVARVAEAAPAPPAAAGSTVPKQAADLDLGASSGRRASGEEAAQTPALAAKGARLGEPKPRAEAAAPRVVLHDAPASPSGPGEGVTLAAPSGGAAGWRLGAKPDLSALPSPLGASYRVTLDGTGHVVRLRRLSVAPDAAAPRVESFLRGLAFVPVPGVPAASELDVRISRD